MLPSKKVQMSTRIGKLGKIGKLSSKQGQSSGISLALTTQELLLHTTKFS